MSCKGCGDKPSRHVPISGDIDSKPPARGFTPDPASGPPGDPFMAFLAAKNMSYEQMVEKKLFQQRLMEQQEEQLLGEMTEAMRRRHVDELVGVINSEKLTVPGMTPGQAVIALKKTLERDNFSFISSVYPKLKSVIDHRYATLVAGSVTLE